MDIGMTLVLTTMFHHQKMQGLVLEAEEENFT